MRDARTRLIVGAMPASGETVALSREEAAHARARRLAAGDTVLLLDGSGRAAVAEIVRLTRTDALVRATAILKPAARPPNLSISVAGLRPERLSWLVEKATELGAGRVTIVQSGRTQAFRTSERLLPRLDRIAREAAKQCERTDWPRVEGPLTFAEALEAHPSAHRLMLDPEGDPFPDHLGRSGAVLLIGPEGGWTQAERDAASSRGWSIVRLPSGKLRAETAAIAGLLLVRAAMERKTR